MNTKLDYARSFGAIIGGYLVMMAVGVIPAFIASKLLLTPPQPNAPLVTPSTYLSTMIVLNSLTGLIGGYVTAVISGVYRLAHAAVLAGILAAIGIIFSLLTPRIYPTAPRLPVWYSLSVGILVPLAVLVGGWLRSRKPEVSRT